MSAKPPKKFPHRVKSGHASVTIRRHVNRVKGKEYPFYRVEWSEGGLRHRETRSDYQAAHDLASEKADKLAAGYIGALTLEGRDKDDFLSARDLLLDTKLSMREAAQELCNLIKVAGGLDQARAACARYTAVSLPVSEVVEKMKVERKAAGVSDRDYRNLAVVLDKFAAAFQMSINQVSADGIKFWLDSLKTYGDQPVAVRTWNNHREAVQRLANWAKKYRHLPREWDEIDQVAKRKESRAVREQRASAKQLYTAEELKLLLTHAGDMLPYVATAAFAGIRNAEGNRIDWSDFNWDDGTIWLGEHVTKMSEIRTVPILPALRAWLEPIRQAKGRICTYENIHIQLRKVGKEAKVQLRNNGLRDSFISYRYRITQNLEQVVAEAGNSARMAHKHYLRFSLNEEAKKWFEVMPA